MDKLKYDPLNTGGNREGSVGALPSLFYDRLMVHRQVFFSHFFEMDKTARFPSRAGA